MTHVPKLTRREAQDLVAVWDREASATRNAHADFERRSRAAQEFADRKVKALRARRDNLVSAAGERRREEEDAHHEAVLQDEESTGVRRDRVPLDMSAIRDLAGGG